MSRRQAQALIWESCEHLIRRFVDSAFLSSPLPNPPLELPDFPAIVPKSSEALVDQAIGIYLIDKAGFNHRLTTIVNERTPDHIKRNIDPESAKQKWMSSNVESISETLICRVSRDWLSASLDEYSPVHGSIIVNRAGHQWLRGCKEGRTPLAQLYCNGKETRDVVEEDFRASPHRLVSCWHHRIYGSSSSLGSASCFKYSGYFGTGIVLVIADPSFLVGGPDCQ